MLCVICTNVPNYYWYQWSRCPVSLKTNLITIFLWIISEIHCISHDECSSQKACVNSLCVDPCSAANPCDLSQECQVLDHQPVCIKVCQCQKQTDCRGGSVCDGCNCLIRELKRLIFINTGILIWNIISFAEEEPKVVTGTGHCAEGSRYDSLTGACILGKSINLITRFYLIESLI